MTITNKTLQQQAITSNVPVSQPILYPDLEVVNMNGFAFTHRHGIVLATRSTSQEIFEFMGNSPGTQTISNPTGVGKTSQSPSPPGPTTDDHYDYHRPYDEHSSYDGPSPI